jgi:DNA repair exonuclease SbcCD ATPase subunit
VCDGQLPTDRVHTPWSPRPHRNVSAGARALQDGAPISSEPVPPVGVSLNGASTLANASSPQGGTDDRQWVLLGGNDGHTPTRAVQALPEPLKQTEADLAEMRVRSLLEENQRLRDALRMDQKKAESAHVERDLAHTQALMGQIQELKELNQSQRDEINRMQVDYDAIAVKLSKAEANVDRKIEMIQILRTQLDDSDQKASAKGSEAASSNAERMKAQERLMQLTEQMKDLKMELDNERKLKENAWERLLHVDHGQVEDLQSKLADEQSKLADERMNAREILDEMRTLRAEKDALTQTMTEERNNLRAEIATLSANKDFMHDEREQALEKLQILREENSQLNAHNAQLDAQISRLSTQVTSAQKDNEALKGQLNFLTQELHARQNELAEFVNSNIQMVSRAQLHAEPSDIRPFELRVEPTDHDEQARFFEQQVRWSLRRRPSLFSCFTTFHCFMSSTSFAESDYSCRAFSRS